MSRAIHLTYLYVVNTCVTRDRAYATPVIPQSPGFIYVYKLSSLLPPTLGGGPGQVLCEDERERRGFPPEAKLVNHRPEAGIAHRNVQHRRSCHSGQPTGAPLLLWGNVSLMTPRVGTQGTPRSLHT